MIRIVSYEGQPAAQLLDRAAEVKRDVTQAVEAIVEDVRLRGDVRFNHVFFSYTPEKEVLHDVSFYAKPGQKIALVGSTGAGKTTITNLLTRFYDINEGSITYDGIDIRDINRQNFESCSCIQSLAKHEFGDRIRIFEY